MRVAINGWFLDQPGTGSGQYLQRLLRALTSAAPGDELLLVLPPISPQGDAIAPAIDLPGNRVRVKRLTGALWNTNPGKVLFEQVAFPAACRRWGADLAHVPYWGSPLWPPVPTVVTVHDLIPLLLPAYRGGPLVRLYTNLAARSARRARAVITDSLASQRDIVRHLRLPADRVHAIYLAAGESFRPEPSDSDEAVRARYGLGAKRSNGGQRYVLYLAGHDVRKNVATLLHAFCIVARADGDVMLAVGGELPRVDPRRSWLHGPSPLFDPRPLVSALGLGKEVRFLGWIGEADKPALYRGAACAVFPSRYEGFGLPILEALASGTPLVASNASSLPELVGDAGFAVDADDARGMAGAILSCLVDDSLAADLRRRGPEQAARFSWMATAQATLAVYRSVLSLHPGPRKGG